MKAVAIIQARLGSTRLPGKVLLDLGGRPLIAHVLERARAIPGIAEVVVAVPEGLADAPLRAELAKLDATVFAGSEDDVLDRYYQAARAAGAAVVLRVTADCPVLDPEVAGRVLVKLLAEEADFATNNTPPSFPHGLDVEAFTFAALEAAWKDARLPAEREHVSPYVRKHPELFRHVNVAHDADLYELRLTVDEVQDLEFLRALDARLPGGLSRAGFREIAAFLAKEPALARINAAVRSAHRWDEKTKSWKLEEKAR